MGTSLDVDHLLAVPLDAAVAGPARLAFEGGRIATIQPREGTAPFGLLAMPALVNAHDHGRGMRTVSFGALDDELEPWIAALGQEPRVDPHRRAAVALARMAESGVGAASHCHNTQDPGRLVAEAEAVSRAARDVGVRIAFAVPVADRNPVVYGDRDVLAATLSSADRAALGASDGRFRPAHEAMADVDAIAAFEHEWFSVQYCPVGPQWVQDSTLVAIAAASASTGRRIHMHLFETRRQREWADAVYPDGLVARLDAIGLLSPRLTVAHGIWLTPDECALLAARGVVVSVNTSSNLRLRSGVADVKRFADAGLPFGIGLDGMALDDDEDMLREIRLLWLLQRGFVDQRVLTPGALFDAACTVGRRTVTADRGGQLVEGAPADLLVLDLAAMAADVIDEGIDPLELMLTRMSKRHVRQLVVAGRSVVQDGRCVSVDLPGLEAELLAEARADRAAAPPDTGRTQRLQTAIRRFYACGCHTGTATLGSAPA